VYLVWALPTVGWLMMVSAWARTKVFLWAVGVPVLTGVLLLWFNEMFNFDMHSIGSGRTSSAAAAAAWCPVPGSRSSIPLAACTGERTTTWTSPSW
jgi:hypothetical protein